MKAEALRERYRLTPQMREYDRLGRAWAPYLMYFHAPNHRSAVVNTDSRGFRLVVDERVGVIADFAVPRERPLSLLAGGSTVFGIGASHDGATIASRLTAAGDAVWLNFGGRAFSSTQELLLFLLHAPELGAVRKVVLLSGVNNLLLYYLSEEYSREYGSLFGSGELRAKLGGERAPRRGGLWSSLRRRRRDDDNADGDEPAPGSLLRPIADHDGEKDQLLVYGLERDIRTWRTLAGALGFELYYVLQPLASWLSRRPAVEEQRLFNELDEEQGERWRTILREHLDERQHQWLAGQLERICAAAAVPFLDANQALPRYAGDGEWLFVDRVHLTDRGNQAMARLIRDFVQ